MTQQLLRLLPFLLAVALASGCDRGGLICEQPLADCGGSCTAVETDPANCGGCGFACAENETCRASSCHPCPPEGCSAGSVFATCFNSGELVGLDDQLVPVSRALVGAGPQALARSGARLLAADALDNALYRFAPQAAPLAKEPGSDRLGHAANQVVVREGRAYVVNSTDNTVQVLDLSRAAPAAEQPDTSRTVDEIPTKPLEAASAANTSPSFAAFAADKLYVTLVGTCDAAGDLAGNRILELDVAQVPGAITRELVFRAEDFEKDEGVAANSPRPSGIATRGSTLYVAVGNLNPSCVGSAGPGYLAIVDTSAAKLAARTIKLPATCRNPAAVLATAERIYVTCPGSYGWGASPDEALLVLDAATEQVLSATRFPRCPTVEDGPEACRTAVPGRMTLHGERLLIADSNAGRLLVTDLDGNVPTGLEKGVNLCAPICYGENNTGCYQYTSDVLSLR